MKRQSVFVLFVIMISQMTNLTFAEITYNLIPLGDLPGGSSTTPYWISDNGQIVGSGFPATGQYLAIKFDLSGGNNIRLSEYYSCARSVNNGGMIVGYGSQGSGAMKALLFDSTGNGNNIILGNFGGTYGCGAYAINNSGQIVGASGNGEASSAWLFDITGKGNNLYLGQGSATSISNNGLIAGNSHPISGEGWHATLFDSTGGGNNIDLGKLFTGDDRSFVHSINDNGQIVGYSGGPGSYTATLYDITGKGNNIALGAIGSSYAESINNDGLIVGREGGNATLFDITGSGNNINLNNLIDPSLGWSLSNAMHINDNGWIIGTGNMGAYLLTPEPLLFTAKSSVSRDGDTVLSIAFYSNRELPSYPAIKVVVGKGDLEPGLQDPLPSNRFNVNYTAHEDDNIVVIHIEETNPLVPGSPASRDFVFHLDADLTSTDYVFNYTGGIVILNGTQDNTEIYVPPFSLAGIGDDTQPVYITIARYGDPGDTVPGTTGSTVSAVYDFEFDEQGISIDTNHTFAITMSFELPSGMTEEEFENTLEMRYFDAGDQQWKTDVISNMKINWLNRTIMFEVSHLSKFAAFVEDECCHPADMNCNYEISMLEILAYIDEWAFGKVSMLEVLEAIDLWAAGQYYCDENGNYQPGEEP